MFRIQFEDYFEFNYVKYTTEPKHTTGTVGDSDSEQSYIMRRLQECTSTQSMAVPEVQRYLTMPVAIMKDSCPLQWWRVHAGEYPTLARMARDIFSISLTSVPVEHVFSAARDILPYQRNRMGD